MSKKDKVYYDESCYVCSLEINMIRNKGESCGIEFIDISKEDFDTTVRDFDSEMIGEFNGEETTGPETFRRMYEKLGFRKIVAFSRIPVINQILNLGYYTFAYWIRPYLPKRRKNETNK